MAQVTCPSCQKRLRAPDAVESITLRCPACKHVFRTSPSEPSAAETHITERVGASLGGQEADAFNPDDAVNGGGRFSEADAALLRRFGSGSGLLELTRETYDASLDASQTEAPQVSETEAPDQVDLDSEVASVAEAVPELTQQPYRQFQIVATALSLANKLVNVHKAELARTRRSARLGWLCVAVLVAAGGFSLWWGMSQAASLAREGERAVNLQRQAETNASNMTARLAAIEANLKGEKAAAERLRTELAALRSERNALQGELSSAKEALAEDKGKVQVLTASLQTAEARIEKLTTELAEAKVALEAAKSAAAARGQAPGPTTRPAGAGNE
jgi:phage FluMu protein Com